MVRTATGLGRRLRETLGQEKGARIESSTISLGRSFPGTVGLPPVCRREEREEAIRIAMERANEKEQDPDTIWTDGSRLGSGGVGVGIAWYEEVPESEPVGSVVVSRRGFCKAGKRRERRGNTY